MKFFLVLGFAVLMFLSVTVRTIVFYPFKAVYYFFVDIYEFIVHKKYNNCPTGELVAYTGLFGKGKTLSAVHHVRKLYKKYNGKPVWNKYKKKFVTQKIHVLSNVELTSIPYDKFQSLQQVLDCANNNKAIDDINDTLTVTLVLGDEFSVQMNSRSFKTNIDPLFLNTLLTCRHHHISLIYTAQRFKHVDALLRQVTSYVVECNKTWRVMVSSKFDAWDLENANNVKMIQPLARFGWFITNKDFDAYDTLACVQNLSKACEEGDMLTEEEIIALQSSTPSDIDSVTHVSRKWKRRYQKRSFI